MKANIPKGLGGPANMQGMIRQAQKMQEQMTELQSELDSREYEVKAGGGAVTILIDGKKQIKQLTIEPGDRRSRRHRDAYRHPYRRLQRGYQARRGDKSEGDGVDNRQCFDSWAFLIYRALYRPVHGGSA